MTVNTETRQRVNENGRVVIPASFRRGAKESMSAMKSCCAWSMTN